MKKYLSVFGLFARSSVYKVLGIAGFLCILETGLFLIQTSVFPPRKASADLSGMLI